MNRSIPTLILSVCLSLLLPATAGATVERLPKGTFEIGFDTLLLMRNQSTTPDPDKAPDDSTSMFNLTFTGGLTPRYFVINNLALSLNLGLMVEQAKTTTKVGGVETTVQRSDSGFLGMLAVNYYLRLGRSFFFTPGLGGGWFFGTRSVPVEGTKDQKTESSVGGPAAKFELAFCYFGGDHINVKVGPNVLFRASTEKPKDETEGKPEPTSTTIDAGFFVGLGYTF